MRIIPTATSAAWASAIYSGSTRPTARATVQRTRLITTKFRDEKYASYLFGNPNEVKELPNIKSCRWQRDVTVDAGTMTLTLYNAHPQAIGQAPAEADFIWNNLGWFTVNRGDDTNPWGHQPNGWTHRLYPDMLIKTYEGYGFDPNLPPEQDPNMLASGVWLIDTVRLDATAMITVTCRDATRLLIDQIAFPPVIPIRQYPLLYQHFESKPNKKTPVVTGGDGHSWINPTYDDDSGTPYVGHNGSIGGHRPSDAFRGAGYWLSIGNASPVADYAFEWIQGTIPTSKVSAVRVKTKGGPYRMYISLHHNTNGWLGKSIIPYDPNDPVSAPNGADIPFIKSVTVDADEDNYVNFKDRAGIDKVRVTFHHLWDSNYGEFPYRAAIYDVDVLTTDSSTMTTWVSNGTHYTGNYADYTDIFKWLIGYGGFFWPSQTDLAFQEFVNGPTEMVPSHPDLVLFGLPAWNDNLHAYPGTKLDQYMSSPDYRPLGDLWADIEQSGTYGPANLTTDIFDKKPLMDSVSYIRDLLGFIFYVDETGAAIFRSPNIWSKGNNVIHPGHRVTSQATRTSTSFVTCSDVTVLNSLEVTLDSKDLRERIVVANAGGSIGAVAEGIRPYGLPFGRLRRVAIYSDQHFTTEKECRIMADMIAIQQLFAFRTDALRIPGNPAIQVDDQIKLEEAITEEADALHYVIGITSNLDHTTGEWWYDMNTHWLGSEPFGKWMFDPSNLSPDTQLYLRALGKIT